MHLVTVLRILNHVCYIVETIAKEAPNEARENLAILIDTFQFEEDIPSKLGGQWRKAAQGAMKCLVEKHDSQGAAKYLSGISQRLWLLVDDHVPISIRLNTDKSGRTARK